MNQNEFFNRIKNIRSRNVKEIPRIIEIVSEAIDNLESLKAKQITVEHRGRQYGMLYKKKGSVPSFTRPFRIDLIDISKKKFLANARLVFSEKWNDEKGIYLERFIYTAQQVLGCYLDLFNQNAAPRVAGTIFECLIACAVNRVCGLSVSSGTVNIPGTGANIQTDLGIYRNGKLVLLAATKTSTRERLSQPFVQKYIIDRAIKEPPKSIIVVIGDIQRIGGNSVQHTFTAGQFQLYWNYLTPMDGVYYIDVPPQAETAAFRGRLKRLYELFAHDLKIFLK